MTFGIQEQTARMLIYAHANRCSVTRAARTGTSSQPLVKPLFCLFLFRHYLSFRGFSFISLWKLRTWLQVSLFAVHVSIAKYLGEIVLPKESDINLADYTGTLAGCDGIQAAIEVNCVYLTGN